MPDPGSSIAPARRARGRSESSTRDRGVTLVEALVTVSVMGIIIVPVMYALMTSIKVSAMTMEAAEVQTVLQNAADRVNRAPRSACYQSYAEAAAVSEWGAAATGAVSVVEHRYVPGFDGDAVVWTPASCASPLPSSGTVQSIVITVTSPYMDVSRSVEVIKSEL